MRILGISAFYHDSAAALLIDGRIVAAAQEERFTRKKHDAEFPHHAARFCLEFGGIEPAQIDLVAFYDKPFLKFERLLETYLAFAPRGFESFRQSLPVWIKDKLFQKRMLAKELDKLGAGVDWTPKLRFSEHHLSHAASAFFPSPFESAAVLTLDGVGEWTTTSLALGRGNDLTVLKEIHFPHSLGLLYSAFTYYTGFKVNSGEYKVMGLAPYGKPSFARVIKESLIDIKPDGSFRLNMEYFDYCTGLRMTNGRFDALFGGPARKPEDPMTQRVMDLAASVQAVTEEVTSKLARSVALETGERNLCLAGGVALNCVANGAILRDHCFERIWIQPAAGDAGGAIGAALAIQHLHLLLPRQVTPQGDAMQGSFLGPEFSQAEIEEALDAAGAVYQILDGDALIDASASALADGRALGWFQGRMEFGPRALGGRSILADARLPSMQKVLNLKVKHRESFRPFAPSVLREDVADWFDLDEDSPYMLLVAGVSAGHRRPVTAEELALAGPGVLNVARSSIPAVTHVDYSARIQTVHRDTHPIYHALISRFKAITGCPLLVNTSFNVRGEPIVCTPADAYRCFMGTQLDALALGHAWILKQDQLQGRKHDHAATFAPD